VKTYVSTLFRKLGLKLISSLAPVCLHRTGPLSADRPVRSSTRPTGFDRPYRLLILLDVFCSLRWGELAALRRRHVDLASGVIGHEFLSGYGDLTWLITW
jgi:integrase